MNWYVRLASEADKEEWDKVVANSSGAPYFHTWDVGNVFSSCFGWKLIRLMYYENADAKGIFPIYIVDTPAFSLWRKAFLTYKEKPLILLHYILKTLVRSPASYATSSPFASYGEPLFCLNADPVSRERLIRKATEMLKKQRKNRSVSTFLSSKSSQDEFLVKAFMNNGYSIAKIDVRILFLTPPLDKIQKNFDKKTRNACRQAMKRGAEVVEAHGKEVRDCYEMYTLTYNRQGISPHGSSGLFLKLYETLSKNQNARVYLAKYKGETVAAFSVILFRPYAIYWVGGFNYEYQSLRPNNLVVWHVITELKKDGFECLDFGGSGPDQLKHYKSGWGAISKKAYFCERLS